MEKKIISCRLCGRKVEVFLENKEIVDVGEVINEGKLGCQHEWKI